MGASAVPAGSDPVAVTNTTIDMRHAQVEEENSSGSDTSSSSSAPVKVHLPAAAETVVQQPAKKLASDNSSSASTTDADKPKSGRRVYHESPEVRANWLSLLSFWWLNDIVRRGARSALMEEDLYEVNPEVDAKYLSDEFDREWAVELKHQADSEVEVAALVKEAEADGSTVPAKAIPEPYKANVNNALYRIFFVPFWTGFVCKLCLDGLQFLQPILLEWILEFVAESTDDNPNPPPAWKGYVYAVALGLDPFFTTIFNNLYFTVMMRIGLRARTILITQLYKKSLKLSPAARQNMSVGQIINLMSTDASKVDLFSGYMHYLWSAVEQVIISIALLVRALGPACLAGVGVVIILIPIQGLVMHHLQRIRLATVKYTDSRVKLMNEILQGIRVIKVYAWEGSFLNKLVDIRSEEMRFVEKGAYTRAYNSALMQTGPVLMSLFAFITVALANSTFEAQDIFSSLSLFNLLRMPLLLFPMTLAFWSDANIAIKRITAFLLAEELQSEPEYVETDEFAINVDHADFAWEKVETEVNVKGMTTEQAAASKDPSKAAPTAPPATSGEATALLPAASEDEDLVAPFHLDDVSFRIPKGSLTVIVGAVGSGKSSLLNGILGEMRRVGGRVQIASTVGYCPQQAWIQNATLKDNILFGREFDEQRYADAIKYCALEADIKILPAKDLTEIGEKGINLSGGQKQRVNLARAVYFDADIIMLDDPLSAVDAHVSKYLFNSCVCDKLRNKTRVLVTHQLQYVSTCDQVLFVENGRITEQGTYQQLMANKGNFFTLMSTYVGEEEEEVETEEEEKTDDATGTKLRGLKTARKSSAGSRAQLKEKAIETEEELVKAQAERKAAESLMQAEERTQGGVPWDIYLYYIKYMGGWWILLVATIFVCLQTTASTWATWWLGLWTDMEYDRPTRWYLGIYAGLSIAQCVFALLESMLTAFMGIQAARHLHNKSFQSVIQAPMAFFDTTPIGRIINRFSRDQDVIDSQIMDTLRMITVMILSVLATFIMICIVTPYFLIPLAPILLIYWYVQKVYRETSRELKRLESIARSPLYAHFSETLTGLATIRAYRAQSTFARVNEERMNGNNRSYYLLVLTQRWLSIRVETIGSLVSFFAALIIVIQRGSTAAGTSGVSLSYAVSVTGLLNWVVRQTVEAENSMNSVERSKFYTDKIAHEAAREIPEADAPLKNQWPSQGAVEFDDLQIRYRPNLPLVLHGVSLKIKGGERIGIVGRTGAGKSSLMVALFRIVEAAGGRILIDGVDIANIGLDALRSKLAIIPQDPVLFSGTIRSNLDPFNQYSDAALWSVLEKTKLKDAVSALEKKLLDPVSEGGENFSVGQRCQICLARAMLRNARVLIMDEATASVDMETDSFIQNSLRANFDCTLLTIAHRLNTICDYDRVLVLSFGKIQEFDTPANLLRNPDSAFSSMVNETGEVNAALLRNIAFKAEQGIRIDMHDVLAGDALSSSDSDPDASSPSGGPRLRTKPSEREESTSRVNWHTDEMD